MHRSAIAEARVSESWSDYQAALIRAIAPLTIDQLRQRPIPQQRSPGALAQHIVYGRALHLTRTLGMAATTELQPFLQWDDAHDVSAASDIVHGLAVTWRVISATLLQGDAHDDVPDGGAAQVIWGLLDHDLPHAGELSLLLGACGLPGVEI
jgi:hypothetical protein